MEPAAPVRQRVWQNASVAKNQKSRTEQGRERMTSGNIRICDAQDELEALNCLFRHYRAGLPPAKRTFTAARMPLKFFLPPGLICFESGQPVAAILWDEFDAHPGLIQVRFYSESPEAGPLAVQLLMERFLAQTSQARVHHFEIWTDPGAKIHAALARLCFQRKQRELLIFRQPLPSAAAPAGLQLQSFANDSPQDHEMQTLAETLHAIYQRTPDGSLYDHFSTPAHCCGYLDRVLNSAFFDARNSWLAWSATDHRLAGLGLCVLWPVGRSIYLEQLGVAPGFRGRGLARALLSRVSAGLQNGLARNLVLTVTTENTVARSLYYGSNAALLDTERAYVRRMPDDAHG